MAKKKKPLKKKTNKPKKLNKLKPQLIATKCTNCNLRLVLPETASHKCVLCGCNKLEKHALTYG